jgi:hypothetical protein
MAKWIICFAAAGFLGAAIFYSPYIGIDGQTQVACPLCPHVTMVGVSPVMKFIKLTVGGGLVNAVSFILVGWIVLTVARKTKRPGN